jgi:NADH dehydrogenase (ubiquinone) 1 alpha subcomplex subunit 9
MKPGTMIGTEDRIMNTWARFAKSWSFLPIFGDGSTKYIPDFGIHFLSIKLKFHY